MQAYRIIAKIRNNRLWRSITDSYPDVSTITQAAAKLEVNHGLLGDYLNMKRWPFHPRLGWSQTARKIADHLEVSVDWLFDATLYGQAPLVREVTMEIDRPQLPEHFLLMLPEPTPEERLTQTERKRILERAIATLSPREAEIIRLRFGMHDGREWTLEEIAVTQLVHRERIRQIEAKALRKLRHPDRHVRDAE